jgi:hypothetical protein
MSFKKHVVEWTQSLVLATSIALVTVIMFVWGGFDLATERGRVILFLWAVGVGMVGTYLALFKFRKGFTEGISGGFL